MCKALDSIPSTAQKKKNPEAEEELLFIFLVSSCPKLWYPYHDCTFTLIGVYYIFTVTFN
jgi:hypothetical protein